ncbi:GNAT family N-acetyltransferase [Sphingopyxis alaskensis]|jgi:RimJ/RimL family protein N-acetyltransferase|uniref:GCN5-related N-acetyltransferase n=1 Tax=Sphingopyxis alaskensis (strain DSM 13593 / LMG 18877 / RB2256) TaxID=317655 RepID=Q1GRH0_SPHAL|nr:GNAT family N-acetyltransferase [Sphingopyxis alaskensis]ABF53752.1 GCN5-related N-acetyltransferase [Sphingopyxis alaskensis RB2256]MCM3419429.1 GNAT family N-acetyltransferase [Sphingopyxis alaskensis]
MFARTERLLLRPGWIEDAPALARAIGEEAVVRNLATAPWPYDERDARDFLSQPIDPAQPRFLIFARTGGAPRLVGGCGISDDPDGRPEMGYWIARPYWGLGFATEAGRQLLHIARAMRLPRLSAGHFLDNPASGAVLRKLGFRPTGQIAQRHSRARGGAAPCALFEEGEADADGAVTPMRDRIGVDEDFREELRLLAA